MQVANDIIKQLGGQAKLKLMIGAKDFVAGKDSVTFRFGKGAKNGINTVKITLNGRDLYDVEYFKIRGMKFESKAKFTDLYNDMLKSNFEETTGFLLSVR